MEISKTKGKISPAQDIKISEIKGVGRPATNSLEYNLKVTNLKQLTRYSEKELLTLHGVGPKAVKILKAELSVRGWSYKMPSKI